MRQKELYQPESDSENEYGARSTQIGLGGHTDLSRRIATRIPCQRTLVAILKKLKVVHWWSAKENKPKQQENCLENKGGARSNSNQSRRSSYMNNDSDDSDEQESKNKNVSERLSMKDCDREMVHLKLKPGTFFL